MKPRTRLPLLVILYRAPLFVMATLFEILILSVAYVMADLHLPTATWLVNLDKKFPNYDWYFFTRPKTQMEEFRESMSLMGIPLDNLTDEEILERVATLQLVAKKTGVTAEQFAKNLSHHWPAEVKQPTK